MFGDPGDVMSRRRFLRGSARTLAAACATLGALGDVLTASAQADAPKMGKKILVVGGGIAGMCAAHLLQKSGIDVEILEAGAHLGGRLRRSEIEGVSFDTGAQFFSSQSSVLLSLISDLGLKPRLIELDARLGFIREGRVRVLNPRDPTTIFSRGLFRFGELREAGLLELARLLAAASARSFSDCTRWASLDDESAEAWSRRTLGEAATKYFVDPFLAGVTFQAPRETSKAVFLWALASLVAPRKFCTLDAGLGQISERLSQSLRASLKTEVREVSRDKGRVWVRDAGGRRRSADHVVIAVPAPVARRIYRAPADVEKPLLARAFMPTVSIAVAMKQGWRRDSSLAGLYALLIPEAERRHVAAVLFGSAIPGRIAGDGEVLQIFLVHAAAAAMRGRSDEQILAAISPELERRIPGFARDRRLVKTLRFENSMPALAPGGIGEIVRYRESAAAGDGQVSLAGDYMGFPGVEGAAESGAWAARRVLRA